MRKKENVAILLFLLLTTLATFSATAVSETALNYSAEVNNITLTYDELNRVVYKNSTTDNITYGYDKDFQGTVANVTSGNIAIQYEYDDKQRLVKEIKTIDNFKFVKEYIYDSMDRIISVQVQSEDIDYIYNKQNRVKQIPNYVSEANYNALSSVENRTYANNLIQTFTYDSETNRITSIEIPNVQNLTYTYDDVGNILAINDRINNRLQNLTYDSLDRLKTAKVGPDRYVYSFDSIGNILKVVKNNQSTKMVYNGTQAHAPSKVITGSAGVDVYHISELNSGTKNRTFEFFLENDRNTSTSGVNWSIDFGSEQAASSLPFTLNSNVMVIVQNNYTDGGDHGFTVTAQSPNTTDKEVNAIKFGVRANQLNVLLRNASERIFEFEVKNDLTEQVRDVSWNCSEGLVGIYAFNLSGNQSLYDYLHVNFTSPGKKNFTCTASSVDGTESKTIELDIKGLEVENYDVLTQNSSRQVVSFNARNYYWGLNTNVSVDTGDEIFSSVMDIAKDENVMVFSEVNYSSDGSMKSYAVTLDGGENATTKYANTFALEGATIENYYRTGENNTRKIITFDVRNNWVQGNVSWNITDPNIGGISNLQHNETIMVLLENNYSSQGKIQPKVTSSISSFVDKISDVFEINPLQVSELNTLSESQVNTVNELVVKNNLNQTLFFNWQFQTGEENLTSTLLNSTSGNVFVYIATNYSNAGVYRTRAIVNSSLYDDNQSGVVVSG